jgi:soluble lytic murein transglycosylase-like protein
VRAAALLLMLHHPSAVQACPQEAHTPTSVVALIRCAAPRLGVSTSKAMFIARRESRYKPWARNPRSSASGVYQVVSGTWRYFVSHLRYGHRIGTSAFDGRANVILSLRYVRAHGWQPWGG